MALPERTPSYGHIVRERPDVFVVHTQMVEWGQPPDRQL
jgi:hypothetical protein